MNAFLKFGIVLALNLAVGLYVYASLDNPDAGARAWRAPENMDFGNARLDVAVDPAAGARVDEELDYRIAKRIGSVEGWRSFLAKHESGAYADNAIAAMAKLLSAETAKADPDYADRRSPEANPASGATLPSEMEVSTDVGNDISNPEEPGAEARRDDAMGGGAGARSQPQPAEVTGRRDDDAAPVQPTSNVAKADTEAPLSPGRDAATPAAAPSLNDAKAEIESPVSALRDAATPAAAPVAASERVGSGAGRRLRAITPVSLRGPVDFPHNLKPRRRAMHCGWRNGCFKRVATAPPFLMALFGQKPRYAFALISERARPNRFQGR
jgi:hypothetical protein